MSQCPRALRRDRLLAFCGPAVERFALGGDGVGYGCKARSADDAVVPGESGVPECWVAHCPFDLCAYVCAAEDEDDVALAQVDLVFFQAERGRVEGRALCHELPHPLPATRLERDDDRDVFVAGALLGREHCDEVGEFVQQADAERRHVHGGRLPALEYEHRVAVQALCRRPTDVDLGELGEGNVERAASIAGSSVKQQPFPRDDEPPRRRWSSLLAIDNGVAGRRLLTIIVHLATIATRAERDIRAEPPTQFGKPLIRPLMHPGYPTLLSPGSVARVLAALTEGELGFLPSFVVGGTGRTHEILQGLHVGGPQLSGRRSPRSLRSRETRVPHGPHGR